MENRLTESLLQDYNNESHFVPIALAAANPGTAAAISTGLAALTKIKAVAAVAEKAKALAGKLGIGGVTQDRFFDRYFQIRDWFVDAGYLKLGSKFHEDALTKYKIRKTQVTDKKSKGNYEPEFKRLHQWCVAVLNNSNPGLGTLWAKYFPAFQMANLGNITSEGALEGLKIVIDAFPPGTFDPAITTLPSATAEIVNNEQPQQTITPIQNPGAVSDKQLTPGGMVTQNDTSGNVMATGLPMNLSKTNLMIMAGIIVGVIVLFFVFKK